MSNLSTYADIKTAVANWLSRGDLTDKIPDFITLCEADLRRSIRHDQGMTERVNLTTSDGSITIPEDCQSVITLKGDSVLRFTSSEPFLGYAAAQGSPSEYTLIGGRAYLYPAPVDGEAISLTYRIRIDVLRFGPNWLLDNHPDVYLYGALVHAAPYLVEDDRVPLWSSMYEKIKSDINLDGVRAVSGGTLQVRSNGPRW